ncbi:hypothetical protein GA0070610_0180 [Micromonospora echinofusca]|uniref:Uncharacterized protein n=1 Tax=Micromonospora echinofusca TaxID=47858 RepID=A0A1C5G2M7_MICEH|nr:hypothetical protein GA0070610_0180 [Micromonospora echinofusca]
MPQSGSSKKAAAPEPSAPLDVRLVVLLALAGLAAWLAFVNPAAAVAVGFGLTVLYTLHLMTKR